MQIKWSHIILSFLIGVVASNATFSQDLVTMKVEDVLVEAEINYQVRFSYSKDIVPYDEVVSVELSTKNLEGLLDQLEMQTGIIHRQRGSRVVLNYDPNLIVVRDEVNSRGDLQEVGQFEQSVEESPETIAMDEPGSRDKELVHLVPLTKDNSKEPGSEVRSEQQYQEDLERLDHEKRPDLMQFSVIPLPHSADRKANSEYHVSFNALAGYNGGLEGVELGLLLNGIRNDVFGVQVAGLGNYVGGNVQGGQLAGFVNYNQGIMRGVQMAGFANLNDQADALQLAGFFNINQRVSRGVQMAGFFNAGRNIAGAQLSGFFNLSVGEIGFQASGFCNVAEKVDGQLAGLVNIAKEVDNLQLGLINIADTVQGASIGLLNFVRRGYNAFELSGSEALYANLALKLGTRRFYNIFQVGSDFKRNIDDTGLNWAVGYGFGFMTAVAPKINLNPELIAMHVQETHLSELEMNLLSQVRVLMHFDGKKKGGLEYFAGPVFNVSVSRLFDPDKGIYGSQIMPYSFYEHTNINNDNPVTTKLWVGFSAGIRI